MAGNLYIVATPIGNLEDITLRALRILKEVDLILAEDTRVTKRLTTHYSILTPIMSYHQHSSEEKKSGILGRLGRGENIALVTDAGTPGISDPGNELIDYVIRNSQYAIRNTIINHKIKGGVASSKTPSAFAEAAVDKRNDNNNEIFRRQTPQDDGMIRIIPIPGASAVTSALSVCGFPANKFVFLGFLPKKKRQKLFNWLEKGEMTFAFYESPKRILKTMEVLKERFGSDTKIFIARELTKMHETLYRGTVQKVIDKLSEKKMKGEIVVVVSI